MEKPSGDDARDLSTSCGIDVKAARFRRGRARSISSSSDSVGEARSLSFSFSLRDRNCSFRSSCFLGCGELALLSSVTPSLDVDPAGGVVDFVFTPDGPAEGERVREREREYRFDFLGDLLSATARSLSRSAERVLRER